MIQSAFKQTNKQGVDVFRKRSSSVRYPRGKDSESREGERTLQLISAEPASTSSKPSSATPRDGCPGWPRRSRSTLRLQASVSVQRALPPAWWYVRLSLQCRSEMLMMGFSSSGRASTHWRVVTHVLMHWWRWCWDLTPRSPNLLSTTREIVSRGFCVQRVHSVPSYPRNTGMLSAL